MIAALQPRIEIRTMSTRDLRGVAAVEQASYEFPWSPGIFRDCLLAGYQCLVLVAEGDINGYAIMSVAAREAHILNLCVHPELQRRGFGRQLLRALCIRADSLGVERAFLEVRPSNAAAINLYTAAGFEQIGVRPSYYQAHGGREDAVIFAAGISDALREIDETDVL
ncbi:MAG: ribosomal protein S18-alanine N-acetyltransferase [Gammaproteobacteria bacterium]|nr:ribosomal protein S18-alanine N-acetyltransferase [Gammaproteobacteria bacterium]